MKSVDAAGRLWDSSKLVALLGRDFAYQSFIDTQARALGLHSDVAQVTYDDPNHPYCGLRVSLSGADKALPSLADVRKSVFHPNATAYLTHV